MIAIPELHPVSLQHPALTYATLDALGIVYERAQHAAVQSVEECADAQARLGAHVCKNLFLTPRNESAYYLLLLRGDKPFRTSELSAQIGSSRLSFAGAEALDRLLHAVRGATSPMGLLHDREAHGITLILDRELMRYERWAFHPCVNTETFAIGREDFLGPYLAYTGHVPVWVTL